MGLESKWATDEPFEPVPVKSAQKSRRNRGKSTDLSEISQKDQPKAKLKDEPEIKKEPVKVKPLESMWADADDEPQKEKAKKVDKNTSNKSKGTKDNNRYGKDNQKSEIRDHKPNDSHRANETRDKPNDTHRANERDKPKDHNKLDKRELRPNETRDKPKDHNRLNDRRERPNDRKNSNSNSSDRDQRKNHNPRANTESNNDEEDVKLTQAGVDFAKRLGITLQVDEPKWERRNEGWGGKGRKDRGFNKPEPKANKPKNSKPTQPKANPIPQQSEEEKRKEEEARAFLDSLENNADWADYDE